MYITAHHLQNLEIIAERGRLYTMSINLS
ncbi:hypothetical protein AZE42_13588 [Rhizopogon vesiculosus]|uniref:Uncharacterized protein n=1 Tax=Rhizopogon vesiculosus TaxID=180088 RepID=A0A1J8Q735_9AGAM|nr:hypothetical protein AZE42_13588 [Rhizopogon vesiculosus]